ncbi:small multi-drug export protein [Candidatus Falkowbacteria bacterium]|nr:small multi-drug export protein [Candidatus Falkowbacteria bacterium]
MPIDYLEIFRNFPPQLATFLIAMIPIAELRVSIPLALGAYKMSIWSSYLYSVAGNIVPVFFILYFIDPVSKFLMKHFDIFNKFFTWLFNHTRVKFEGKYAKYGALALVIFVAIPLPITGAWTGALASFLFQIPRKLGAVLVSLGVMIAGIVVTLAYYGVFNSIKILF